MLTRFPGADRAQFLSAFHRRLHPAPGGRGMRLDDSALADVPVGKCAAQSAPCSSGCTGTSLVLPPLPERTLSVGVAVSSDRSRTSRSSASETRRPARHCSSISSFAFGLGAALIMAFISSASRYSGMRFSRLGVAPVLCFGVTPAGSAAAGDCSGRFNGQGRTPTLFDAARHSPIHVCKTEAGCPFLRRWLRYELVSEMQAFTVFPCIGFLTATDDRPMSTRPKQRTAVMMPAPFEPSLSRRRS